jgi:hypothetical protein
MFMELREGVPVIRLQRMETLQPMDSCGEKQHQTKREQKQAEELKKLQNFMCRYLTHA